MEGAGLGSFIVGRGGKETRLELDQSAVTRFVDGEQTPTTPDDATAEDTATTDSPGTSTDSTIAAPAAVPTPAVGPVQPSPSPPVIQQPTVQLSASPSVHVNVEIHIAADATADTVREIFRNMARYVLDKPLDDDDN